MPKRIRRVREGAPGNGPVATPAPRPRAYLTKTCSGCGVVKAKLRLSERMFRCEHCFLVLDRDLNAARNLAQLVSKIAGRVSSPSCGATGNEPDGNPGQTRTARATGTATGRPTRSTPRRKATAA
ncbi:MAG TPA: zinc ribbon domain-containing protein [Pseudonocardiaceae bacterium]|nr:zinc ribbon domain-containing protein [Pseudonocardiaceae bacterium]